MKRTLKPWWSAGWLLLTCSLALFPGGKADAATAPSARRIVFLGDSITYGGRYIEYFETFLRLQYPEWQGEVLNLGLPSETVSGLSEEGHAGGAFPRPDLHERLDRVLAKTKPDLVIVCYGINDGIYLPFSEERFARFQKGMQRLREKVAGAGAAVIHLTPPTYDPIRAKGESYSGPNYNEVLDRYSEWLLSRKAEGWVVLDIHGPMNRYLAEGRGKDRSFRLADDGVHPNDIGHWLMARPLLVYYGCPSALGSATSAAVLLELHPQGAEVLSCVEQRQRVLKDAWLTETGHQRPGMGRGLPLAEAERKAADLLKQIRASLEIGRGSQRQGDR
jgi:lysophospholipase L1-like esterase